MPSQGREPMRVAHFVQRYPPALGGSEAYFARLSRYLDGVRPGGVLVAARALPGTGAAAGGRRRGALLPPVALAPARLGAQGPVAGAAPRLAGADAAAQPPRPGDVGRRGAGGRAVRRGPRHGLP